MFKFIAAIIKYKFNIWLFLIVTQFFLVSCMESRVIPSGEPVVSYESNISSVIDSYPDKARFKVLGLTFLNSQLFVASNIGLYEIEKNNVKKLYRWVDNANLISGPWNDQSIDGIWIQRYSDGFFIRYSQGRWNLFDVPPPPKGGYSRGDILKGFSGVSDKNNFWLIGAGNVWKFDAVNSWLLEPTPPAEKYSSTVGFFKIREDKSLYIVRDSCPVPPCNYDIYTFDRGQWISKAHLPVDDIEQIISTSEEIFIRGDKGEIIQVRAGDISILDVPGKCESIARTTNGKLIASFFHKGIFVLDNTWKKLFDVPYSKSEGEHWAYLAENNGKVAFATSSIKHNFKDDHTTYTGTNALWITEGNKFIQVKLW